MAQAFEIDRRGTRQGLVPLGCHNIVLPGPDDRKALEPFGWFIGGKLLQPLAVATHLADIRAAGESGMHRSPMWRAKGHH